MDARGLKIQTRAAKMKPRVAKMEPRPVKMRPQGAKMRPRSVNMFARTDNMAAFGFYHIKRRFFIATRIKRRTLSVIYTPASAVFAIGFPVK